MRSDGLKEIYVGLDRDEFIEIERGASPVVLAHLAAGCANLGEGNEGEVNLDAGPWVTSAGRLLAPGDVLVLDYGESAHALYGARHPTGTLRCFRQHVMSRDPYAHVGRQDITAHVDISAVVRAAAAAGLTLESVTRQSRLMRRLGLEQVLKWLAEAVPGRVEQRAHRAALRLLADPAHLGRIAVLLFGKSAPSGELDHLLGESPTMARLPRRVRELRSDPIRLAESL
jgi:SAM-dependent MidA family methyltransferase